MKISTVTPVFLEAIPDRLEEGILYICERYRTAAHKCCCGCGEEVITPLTAADWSVHKEGNTVSLIPSIGNWSFECKSHYWINRNQIMWAKTMSQNQIKKIKAQDKSDKAAYIAAINEQKEQQASQPSLIAKLWLSLTRWWRS